jgi:lysophospholipase L1-like esterase
MRQFFEYHPVIGYRYIPGLKVRVPHESGGYLFKTNRSGFRCRHEFSPAASSQRRVFLFGDSFTAGEGVSDGQRFGDLLEKQTPQLDVWNFGLPGTGTDQHYLAYQEYAKNIPCDLLILAVFIENIRRVTAHYRIYLDENQNRVCYAKPYFELSQDGHLELQGVPPRSEPLLESELPQNERAWIDQGGRYPAIRKFLIKTGLKEMAQKFTRYQPLPEYDRPNHVAWRVMRALLTRWIKEHPGPVLLMPIPQYQYIEELSDPRPYQSRFQELVQETGVFLHDPLKDFLKHSKEERRAFRFNSDAHLTPRGHDVLASSLAARVKDILSGQKTHGS